MFHQSFLLLEKHLVSVVVFKMLSNQMNFVQVAWSLGILLSSWPALIVSTGLMFAKRITLQSIQPSKCSGEFYLNLNEHQSCTVRIMDNVFTDLKIARVSRRLEVENF